MQQPIADQLRAVTLAMVRDTHNPIRMAEHIATLGVAIDRAFRFEVALQTIVTSGKFGATAADCRRVAADVLNHS